jgi:hypothetical protein
MQIWPWHSHHAVNLLTQTSASKKRLLIFDTPEHVDSENIKFQVVEHIRDSIRANTVKNDFFKQIKKLNFGSIFANFCQFYALKITF